MTTLRVWTSRLLPLLATQVVQPIYNICHIPTTSPNPIHQLHLFSSLHCPLASPLLPLPMTAPAAASDFVTAVVLAMNPDQHQSSPLLPAALQYVSNIQSSPDGWKLCLSMLHQLALSDGPQQVSFFCLQTLTAVTTASYASLSPADRQALCTSLMLFLRDVCPAHPPSSFLRNKLAALFTVLCQRSYPEVWVSFFTDLIGLLSLSPVIVDIVLRILLTIDTEIVVHDWKRSDGEVAHNSRIKDHVRSTADMANIMAALYSVLSGLMVRREHEKLIVNGLRVVKEYTGWIDIALVANERWVTLLYGCCTAPVCEEYRALGLACVREICNKKMESGKKVELIASYRVIDMLASLPLRALDDTAAKEVGALIASIGKQLLDSLPASSSSAAIATVAAGGEKGAERVREMIETVMGLSYAVLETCEWQTVDESGLLELIKAFIRTMTASSYLLPQHQLHARRIFHAISEAMLFPASFTFPATLPSSSHSLSQSRDLSDTDAAFLEFRSSLHVTFSNLVPNMPDLSIELTSVLVSSLLSRWREEDWRRAEGALRLFYDLGEALKGGVNNRILDEPMSSVLASLLRSEVSSSPNAPVVLVYQLIVHRYTRFLEQHPDYLPSTLSSFLDHRGIHHSHAVVRSKACYLLYKLLLSFPDPVRKTMRAYVDGMIGQVQAVVDRVLKSEAGVDVVSGEECQYLCEVLGMLVSASVTGDACVAYVTMLLGFFASHLSAALTASAQWGPVAAAALNASLSPSAASISPRSSSNPPASALSASTSSSSLSSSAVDLDKVGTQLALLFDSFGNVSKPLSKDTQRVSPLFDHCFTLILQLFAVLPSHDLVRAKTVFVIHRMVECQGTRVLTHVQPALTDLVRYATVGNVAAVLPLFSQMVVSFKAECLTMLDSHFIPLCSKVMECLEHYSYIDRAPSSASSASTASSVAAGAYSTDKQERLLVQQRYYQFLKTVLLDLPAALTSPHNAPHLFTVCDTLVAGWKQSDSSVQKTATQCLALLLKHAQSASSIVADNQLQALVYNKLTPDLLSLLVSPAMQLSDAGYVSVFRELIPLLRAMCAMYGEGEVRLVLEWLVSQAGWSEEQSREWIELLREGDTQKLSDSLKRRKAEKAALSAAAGGGLINGGGAADEGKLNGSHTLRPPQQSSSSSNGSRQADQLTLSRSNSSTTSSYHSALSR